MKKIDDNLLAIFNTMFKYREDWKFVTDEQKETFFFIINRNLSKKYKSQSQLLNLKNVNKISAMNLWFYFLENEPYPKWFWSKGEKSDKSEMPEKDYKLLIHKLQIKDIDLDYLIKNHIDFIQEELKYFKDAQKNK